MVTIHFHNLIQFFLSVNIYGLINCLIAEDLADLANHLSEYQCKVLQSVMTKKPIKLIKLSCFDFLIKQRVDLKTQFPRDGDSYFQSLLTKSLIDLGLEGSAMKLINLNLNEKIFSANLNQVSLMEQIRDEEEAETNKAIVKNPFKSLYSSTRRHDTLIQQSNRLILDIVILVSVIILAIILTYALIVTIRNLDVPDDLIDRDEVALLL